MAFISFKFLFIFCVLFGLLNASPVSKRGAAAAPVEEESSPSKRNIFPINYYHRNLNTIQSIYNLIVYPNQIPIIEAGGSAVPPGLFSSTATGRITPVGNFTAFEDTIEYFFALAPIPSAPTYIGWTSVKIVQFSSSCPEVAASTVYITASIINPGARNNGQIVSYLKQTGFWRFDATGAVAGYDLQVPTLQEYVDATSGPFTAANQVIEIEELCGGAMELCTGANQQYSSVGECIALLTAKPFGNEYEAWSDTVACRLIHVILAEVRPAIHCPHVGPTGGGKCVTYPYNQKYFLDDVRLFGSDDYFMCPYEFNLLPILWL